MPVPCCWQLRDFEESRDTHTATYAHGNHHVFYAATFAFDERMTNGAGTGHTVRVTD